MQVETITVGMETSVKIKEYQYTKPRVDITFKLDSGETPAQAMKIARERVFKEITKIEDEIKGKL